MQPFKSLRRLSLLLGCGLLSGGGAVPSQASQHCVTVVFSKRDQLDLGKRSSIRGEGIGIAFSLNNVVIGENVVKVIEEVCKGALASWLPPWKCPRPPCSLKCSWSFISKAMSCHTLCPHIHNTALGLNHLSLTTQIDFTEHKEWETHSVVKSIY